MSQRRREVLMVVQDAQGAPKPSAYIEVNAQGRIVYGVRCADRSLAKARQRCQEEFATLEAFAADATRRALESAVKGAAGDKGASR